MICNNCGAEYFSFKKKLGVLGFMCDECYDNSLKERQKYCRYFDSGWCYRPESKYSNCGCIGIKNCAYTKSEYGDLCI